MMFYPRLSLLHVLNNRNYDVYGASSTPGPNAPLGNLCNRSARSQYSAEAAFKQWTAAGFPAKQLLLGLPLYGYVSDSTKTSLTENFSIAMEEPQQVGAMNGAHAKVSWVDDKAAAETTVAGDLKSWWGQQIPFNKLVASGALVKNRNGTYSAANGYTEGKCGSLHHQVRF